MHVLTAAHDLYPDPGSGGSGRFVGETARRLVAAGHEVSVVTRRRGDVPRRETVDGVEVVRYDLAVADRPGWRVTPDAVGAARRVAAAVAALAERQPVDLVSHQGPVTSLLVDRAVDPSVPRVVTLHSPWPTEYRLRTRGRQTGVRRWANARLRWHLERRLLSRAEAVVTLSEYVANVLRETYGPVATPTVVPGGVDVDRFRPDAGPSDLVDDGDPAVLTVRRLSPRMGLARLLSAVADVVETHPGVRLYVAGDGPLRGELERRARRLGVDDHVSFLGFVPESELAALYATADLFVLPTRELEGFGLATLEALSSGTPVAATPVGGTTELLAGLRDDPAMPAPVVLSGTDAAAIRSGLAAWATTTPAERAAAGRACRRHAVERYTWARTVARLAAVYSSVTGERWAVDAPTPVAEGSSAPD